MSISYRHRRVRPSDLGEKKPGVQSIARILDGSLNAADAGKKSPRWRKIPASSRAPSTAVPGYNSASGFKARSKSRLAPL